MGGGGEGGPAECNFNCLVYIIIWSILHKILWIYFVCVYLYDVPWASL